MDYWDYLIKNMEDRDSEPDGFSPKVCICENYLGTTNVEYCPACGDWTDNIELSAEAGRAEMTYSEALGAENALLLENFYLVLAQTRAALARGRK